MLTTFASGSLVLEGELVLVAGFTRAGIVCHPHPQYGGDMYNPVVEAIAEAMQGAHCATLRFNFRGVGTSTGTFDNGIGERLDAAAAVQHLRTCTGLSQVILAGYSFGALVALEAAALLPEVGMVIAVAPPVAFLDVDAIARLRKPATFIAGDADPYCSAGKLSEQLAQLIPPLTPSIIAGADHFFMGHCHAVAASVGEALRRSQPP